MVAMNPQTWDSDVREIEPGGYLFYDCSKPLPKSKFREDIHLIGMPLTEICNVTYSDPRQRQLFKNIIYVGALSALLDIDPAAIEKLFSEQYKGKEALLQSNVKALHLGRDYALQGIWSYEPQRPPQMLGYQAEIGSSFGRDDYTTADRDAQFQYREPPDWR